MRYTGKGGFILVSAPEARISAWLTLTALALLWHASDALALIQAEQERSQPIQQSRGGVQAAEPRFRIVRSVSGSKGFNRAGQFIIEDPRTVFHVPEDQQVIVYFEWEGPLGSHQFEGLWKNPEGKVVVISDFEYEATNKRFGGYWTLTLTEGVKPGVWTLEARVDGELAGAHTFQIVAAPRPASAIPTRRVLAPSEIYRRALAATVSIEKLTAAGERLSAGSGFLLDDGLVVTAFQVIDGARTLRLHFVDGRSLETNQVVAWDRWQDWAMLKVEPGGGAGLARALDDSWAVGDRCFSLDTAAEGGRIILDGNIVGKNTLPRAGDRLNLNFHVEPEAIGSPLLNKYGEVIGVVSRGGALPGIGSLRALRLSYPGNLFGTRGRYTRVVAVPANLLSAPPADASVRRLDELARTAQFVSPLVGSHNISRGTVTRRIKKEGFYVRPIDERFEYSRDEGKIAVLLSWNPLEKRKGRTFLRVYDLDNQLRAESKPRKTNLKPGKVFDSWWELSTAQFPLGTYRVDVIFGSDPIWRSFFRIVE